jgi:hypothetical protein
MELRMRKGFKGCRDVFIFGREKRAPMVVLAVHHAKPNGAESLGLLMPAFLLCRGAIIGSEKISLSHRMEP